MPVLSVDLAYRRWSDLGVVILERMKTAAALPPNQVGTLYPVPPYKTAVFAEVVPWGVDELDPSVQTGAVDPEVLAGRLNHLCAVRGIRVLMLDGPQAWKASNNGLEHARVSERQLNTACKTGLPGVVKPRTYRPFAEFCLDVYDALCRRGWRRLDSHDRPGNGSERVLVESYPCAAWKSLGLTALPSKKRAQVSDLATAFRELKSVVPITVNRPPNHDQLQAIVGGLPGLALADRDVTGVRIVGAPPRREAGHWREGFIVLPVPPSTGEPGMRWVRTRVDRAAQQESAAAMQPQLT